MRSFLSFASFAAAFACSALACAPGLNQSNGAKMGEALAFAAAAGSLQVAQAAAEQSARNNAPVARSSGLGLSPACGDQGQYACVTVAPSPAPSDAPEPEMSDDEARDYVLGYANGVRKIHRVPPLVRDESLDEFAQAGSDELSQDHRLGKHLADHGQDMHATVAEIQGSPEGSAPGPLQDQIAEILLRMMDEGPGGMHHDLFLRPEWRSLGVGIARRAGRMFLTVDFSN